MEEGVRVLVVEKTSDDWYVTLNSLFDYFPYANTLQVDRRDRRAAGPDPCCICSAVVGGHKVQAVLDMIGLFSLSY